jgi:hypothetical protein
VTSRHRYAGLILAAGFPLPELPRATRADTRVRPSVGRPFVTLTMGPRRRTDVRRDWLHQWRQPQGSEWMRVAKRPGGYVVQFPRLAEFDVTARAIVCSPRVGVPARTVRHLLLDQVLPAILASRGRFVLHASAVSLDGRAIGFIGLAGAGKSTIAAALARGGAATLTDDALVIDVRRGRAIATPAYPGLRLWPDSRALFGAWSAVRRARVSHYNAKERWFGGRVPFERRPRPLDALYLLARGRRVGVRPLSPQEAMMALIRFSMLLDATDRAAVRRGFERASAVVERVAVFRLTAPSGARPLRKTCELLYQHRLRDS